LNFFYPLRLGRRRQVSPSSKDDDRDRRPWKYEAWREGVHHSSVEYEEDPESRVLERLLTRSWTNRFWLVLGEPGSGKTTLLETWFRRLANRVTKPIMGTVVPVLVRLRSVSSKTWHLNDISNLADALWMQSLTEEALLENIPFGVYQPDRGRAFEPLWLLDGLDELSAEFHQDQALFQKVARLPGHKLVSARIAVYQSLRKTGDRYKVAENEYEILGLRPFEQREFLRQALPGAKEKAEKLFEDIQENIQVRLLAANPLMLSLMAEVAGAGPRIPLPASRAEFYERAIDEMWYEKLKNDDAVLRLHDERDRFLTQKAAQIGLASLRAPLTSQITKNLERGLRRSGLIRVDDRTRTFEFIHLTFQEYYLALSLAKGHLREILEKHWSDARYEETLALIISLLARKNEYQEIEEGVRWLVEWGQLTHNRNSDILWEIGSSPLRVACHLLRRSAISPPTHKIDSLVIKHGLSAGNSLRKLALSHDSLVPLSLVTKLARDPDDEVRLAVASNANTPASILNDLTDDESDDVRWRVAENPNTTSNALAKLQKDGFTELRQAVAENPNTPSRILSELADDHNLHVVKAVAQNNNTPSKTLIRLVRENRYGDWGDSIRQSAAANTSTPLGLLTKLAGDDWHICLGLAENANTPRRLLAKFARDKLASIRVLMAQSTTTPPDLLADLACDSESSVRTAVAKNINACPALLAGLAQDPIYQVRAAVAANPNASLARIIHED